MRTDTDGWIVTLAGEVLDGTTITLRGFKEITVRLTAAQAMTVNGGDRLVIYNADCTAILQTVVHADDAFVAAPGAELTFTIPIQVSA